MFIREFFETQAQKDVDLLDDLQYFMQNDDEFYRRIMYPIISKMKKHIKAGKRCHDNMFKPCVDHAAEVYCKKFDVEGNAKSVFTDVDRDKLAKTIFAQEKHRIESGVYDNGDSK